MVSKRIYKIQKKRFIEAVRLNFGTVSAFCKKAGISRQRFYTVLSIPYAKKGETFIKLFNILNESLEDGKYDLELFWQD